MKSLKKFFCVVLFAAIAFVLSPQARINAATNLPSKARAFTNMQSSISYDNPAGKRIKSVSSNSKNLIAKITNQAYVSNDNGKTTTTNTATISLYGLKDGKYTVTVNFTDNTKKKITVYSYPKPYSIKVDGKDMSNILTNKSKIKVKVSMTKGNTLKDLKYSAEKKVKSDNEYTTNTVYTKFKNGQSIKVNKQPNHYSSTYKNDSYEITHYSDGLFAYTRVLVSWKDKYTKQTETFDEMVTRSIIK